MHFLPSAGTLCSGGGRGCSSESFSCSHRFHSAQGGWVRDGEEVVVVVGGGKEGRGFPLNLLTWFLLLPTGSREASEKSRWIPKGFEM